MRVPSMTAHAMKRYVERSGVLKHNPIQKFMEANQVCQSVSGKYNNKDRARLFKYDDDLIYVYEPESFSVITVLSRGESAKYEAMIKEFEV